MCYLIAAVGSIFIYVLLDSLTIIISIHVKCLLMLHHRVCKLLYCTICIHVAGCGGAGSEEGGLRQPVEGFTPYFSRVAPHTVLTFVFPEQMRLWYLQVLSPL